jgi:excisionase family DNA binding protein
MSTLVSTCELLTVGEAARRLKKSRMSVYRLIGSGDLPAFRASASDTGPLRVREDDLAAWLERRRVTTPRVPADAVGGRDAA